MPRTRNKKRNNENESNICDGTYAEDLEDLKTQVKDLQILLTERQNATSSKTIKSVPQPEKFSFIRNEWSKWLKYYERYRSAAKLNECPENI